METWMLDWVFVSFFAFGVYLSVFLVASVGVDVLGRGSFCFFIGCGVSVFWIWLGDNDVGSLTLFLSWQLNMSHSMSGRLG